MINSFDNNKKISYGAVKDIVPQNVNAKLPQNVQNYDAKEQVQDSMVGSISNGIMDTKGMKPWQIGLSILGAIGVVFGGSALLRRFVKNNGIFKAGEKLDAIYNSLKDTGPGKAISKITGFFKKNVIDKFKKTSIGKLFKKDASGIRSNMMRGELSMAQAQIRGSKFEACDEITDALQAILNGGKEKSNGLFGKARNFLLKLGEKVGYVKKGGLRFEGEKGLREMIKTAGHEAEADELVDVLKKYSENMGDMDLKFKVKDKFMPVLKDFFGISGEGKISELMAGAKNVDFTQRIKPGLTHEVNMLNAVKNMMILDGQGAKTPLGKGFQKFLLKAVEAPTNGIMSRAKMGLLMAIGIYVGIINKIQKAPKGEKISTAGDEITGDIGAYMMLPVNASIMYGLASFKNLGVKDIKGYRAQLKGLNQKFKEATSSIDKQAIINEFKQLKKTTYGNAPLWQKILRIPGQILSFGLEKGPGQTKLRGVLGGALRFITMLFIISPFMMKPIKKLSAKIFGETTEMKKEKEEKAAKKAQKQQAKELRELQKQNPEGTIPMSEDELAKKLMENPEVLQKLQNDPKLLEDVSNNPQLLMQMFEENQNAKTQNQITPNINTSSNNTMSPSLRDKINGNNPQNNGILNPQTANIHAGLSGQVNSPQVLVNGQAVNPSLNNNAMAQQTPLVQNNPLPNNAINKNSIEQPAPIVNQTPELQKKNDNQVNPAETQRSYIPSSNPISREQDLSNITPEQKASFNEALRKADEAERSASRYL